MLERSRTSYDARAIVVGNGSGNTKAGFAGDEAPSVLFPSYAALEEALKKKKARYQQLRVVPENHPVLLSEVAMNPSGNRERTTQTMFETFNVPAMYLNTQPVLSLYASGITTALSWDCGAAKSETVPIIASCVHPHARRRTDRLPRAHSVSSWLRCRNDLPDGIRE